MLIVAEDDVGVINRLLQLIGELCVRPLEYLVLAAHEEVEHPLPLPFAPSSWPMNFGIVDGQLPTSPGWFNLFCRHS